MLLQLIKVAKSFWPLVYGISNVGIPIDWAKANT
jgi:hypothetical protein